MDFHKSAEELQTLRKELTQAYMPCRGGPKDSVVDGSEEQFERLKGQLEELQQVLSEERILRKGNISIGEWNSERNLVEVSVAKGVHWNVFGKSIQGRLVLEPDEALYMLDHVFMVLISSGNHTQVEFKPGTGMLELYYDDLPVSVQQAYELLLSDEFPLHHYTVYSHLRNLGFIVLRYQRRKQDVTDNEERMAVTVDSESVERSLEMDDGKTMKKVENEHEEKVKELKESMVESEEKETEETQVESENKIVNENSPVLYYWKDEECQPLVHPSDATSLENILNKLQVIKGQTVKEASQHTSPPTKFQIIYYVFQPQKNFKKTDTGLPNHSVCICKFSDPFPTIGEINFLASQSYPVPLKYAVVDGRDVSFYSILDVQLPTYIER